APQFELPDYFGQTVKIGGPNPAGATLLMFTAPSCPVCDKLFPIIKSMARAERLSVIMISDGAKEEHERFLASHDLGSIRYLVSPEVGMTFQVGKIPYGILIDASGTIRAKGLTNTREHLESLVEADKSGFASIQEYISQRKKQQAAA